MKKPLQERMRQLEERDYALFQSIYSYRCLTLEQIKELHFSDKKTGKVYGRIQKLIQLDFLKEVPYKHHQHAYFLTSSGIDAIRYHYDMPTNIYDMQKKVVKRGYYRASELEMYPKLINHQIHLNQFVIEFNKIGIDVPYKYFDEKYVSQYSSIRPDGMLSVLDVDFFLEMDMATESKKQLGEKWDHYRRFLQSREYAYREKRIIVLFIVDGTHRLKERIDLVKFTIFDRLLDVLNHEFEIYVGTQDELINLLKKRLIPACKGVNPHSELLKHVLETYHGFTVTNGQALAGAFDNTQFQFYLQKTNELGHLETEHGRLQEFVVDDYFFENCSVLSKVAYMEKLNTFFKEKFNRTIPFVLIGKNEEQLYRDLRMMELLDMPNVYFSTYQRLKTKPFHEAIFQFDSFGNMQHFKNTGLSERIFECNMEQLLNP